MKRIDKIQRELSEQAKQQLMPDAEADKMIAEYQNMLDNDLKYSLMVDPEDKYSMEEAQKTFIKYYIDFKDIVAAATLADIDIDTARAYLKSYASQQEIRRINLAMYHRQFSTKLLSIDAIGGWLSSLLMDLNVPIADRLKTTDKLRVAQMIIDLNKAKQESLFNPSIIVEKDIEAQIKDLSVETLRQLIASNTLLEQPQSEEKDAIIKQLCSGMSSEEEAFLRTLSVEELLKLVEESNTKK